MYTQPKAFVRFARAYMNDNGLSVIPSLIPEFLHTGYQTARWSIGASYVRLKHKAFIKEKLKVTTAYPKKKHWQQVDQTDFAYC
jgi:hypothetical protein